MIDSNLFNSHEKAVVVSLLIEMANVDDNVAFEELVTTNNIFARLGIDRDTFETGRALDTKYAIEAVKAMTDEQKIVLGKLLVEVIDADDKVTHAELALLNHICRHSGIDVILNKKEEKSPTEKSEKTRK